MSQEPEALPYVLSNRGLLFPNVNNQDGSDSAYSLRCNEAYNVNTAAVPTILPDDKGGLMMVTTVAVSTTADRGCSFQESTGLPDITLGGFVQNPAKPSNMLLTTEVYMKPAQIFASEDYGHTWTLKVTNKLYSVYEHLITTADGMQVIASGKRYDPTKKSLLGLWAISTDGGATWTEQDTDNPRYPLGYHPTQPNVVFSNEPDPNKMIDPVEKLLRSEDGGKTFTQVMQLPPITAFAATPDGSLIWVGSGTGGLYVSTDAGKTFTAVSPEQITGISCLTYRQDVLWICANFAPNDNGVWSSHDKGKSWAQLFDFGDIRTQVLCEVAKDPQMYCKQPWIDWQFEQSSNFTVDAGTTVGDPPAVITDASAPPAVNGGPARDAGVHPSTDASGSEQLDAGTKPVTSNNDSGGCSASTRGSQDAQLASGLLVSLGLVLWRRRRRS